MTKDNRLLGEFDLNDIPAMKAGDAQIEVTFDLDENGVLNVSALEKTGKKTNKIRIVNDKGRLSTDEINKLVAEAEEFKIADERSREKVEARTELEQLGS